VTAYITRRLGISVVTLWLVSLVVFLLARGLGDPQALYLDPSATEEDRSLLAATMGLDQPLAIQYLYFLRDAVRGDLGQSYTLHQPVTDVFFSRFGNTLQLGAVSFLLGALIALPAGVFAALHRESTGDWAVRGFVFLGQGLPHFWLGIMLILLVSVKLNWLPPAGKGGPSTFVLPAITMGWAASAEVTRLVRSSMLDVLSNDFVRTARAKGLSEIAVIYRHAVRNAMIPVVAYASLILVRAFIFGSITVETIFGWPGIGRLAYESTLARDYNMIQGIVLMLSLFVILTNLLADLAYGFLDPRIRYR
jgi:peptide/nickel transport system permease protein